MLNEVFIRTILQYFQSSKVLVSLISKLILSKIQSSNILTISNDHYLTDEAILNICIDLPNWCSFNRDTLENKDQ